MDNDMIMRCKAQLERCFAPAIDFEAPYAKVMAYMAIKEIIKELSTITNIEAKNLKCFETDATMIHTNCYTCGGHAEGMRNILEAMLNAK